MALKYITFFAKQLYRWIEYGMMNEVAKCNIQIDMMLRS